MLLLLLLRAALLLPVQPRVRAARRFTLPLCSARTHARTNASAAKARPHARAGQKPNLGWKIFYLFIFFPQLVKARPQVATRRGRVAAPRVGTSIAGGGEQLSSTHPITADKSGQSFDGGTRNKERMQQRSAR